jgi:hypothetical protein
LLALWLAGGVCLGLRQSPVYVPQQPAIAFVVAELAFRNIERQIFLPNIAPGPAGERGAETPRLPPGRSRGRSRLGIEPGDGGGVWVGISGQRHSARASDSRPPALLTQNGWDRNLCQADIGCSAADGATIYIGIRSEVLAIQRPGLQSQEKRNQTSEVCKCKSVLT